jgi:hypothetical protein
MGRAPFDAQGNPQPQDILDKAHQARAFLSLELLSGPRLASEVRDKARAYGLQGTTLDKARRHLGITSQRRDNVWYWLPPKA